MTTKAGFFEGYFKLSERNTTVRTELMAGFTTFMTMAYILVVNPLILKDAGMDFGAVFTATALSSVIATLIMALYANLPFALAPGMGLNAFFAYTVVLTMGYSWQMALTAVFVEGLIFIALTFLNVREAIVNCIPMNIKYAISVGIGLFIAFIGLKNAGIIVDSPATFVTIGDIGAPAALVALFGVLVTGWMLAKDVKGALLIGIFASTVLGAFNGVTNIASFDASQLFQIPSLAPIMFKLDFSQVFSFEFATVLLTFLFIDMFDTVGTLIGVSSKAGMLDDQGRLPAVNQALLADAVGTTAGALLGTSTVTTYVESAAGVAEGGRTGLTALTVAGFFAVSLFLAPVFLLVPGAATAPALIIVGLFMMSPVKNIDLEDFTEAIPAFFTIVMMPLSYSIAEGIVFGVVTYVILKALAGKAKEVTLTTWIIAGLFLGKLFLM